MLARLRLLVQRLTPIAVPYGMADTYSSLYHIDTGRLLLCDKCVLLTYCGQQVVFRSQAIHNYVECWRDYNVGNTKANTYSSLCGMADTYSSQIHIDTGRPLLCDKPA